MTADMTAIADPSHVHDLTVQGTQAARARAIKLLCEDHDLPTISTWMVDAFTSSLIGMLHAEGRDVAEQRKTIEAWAGYLHVDVEETTVTDVLTVSAEGPCEYGVRVRVYAQFPAAIKEVAA